jgi:hypothetical protein
VSFIGPGLAGAEAEVEALGDEVEVVVLAAGEEDGPPAHAALTEVNDNAAVIVSRRAFTRQTITPSMVSCLPSRVSGCVLSGFDRAVLSTVSPTLAHAGFGRPGEAM